MQRVKLNSQATISETLLDGTGSIPASPPGSATVTITRDDGTVLATDTPATATGGSSEFSVLIDNAMTSQLDRLTLVWTNATVGSTTTFVEVVGGFLFTVGEFRAQSTALADTAKYPTRAILEIRTMVEDAIESELGYALVPRYQHDVTVAGAYLRLKPHVRSIRSINSDGTALTTTDLEFGDAGYVTGVTWGSLVDVAYEHGLDGPSPRATLEALTLARSWLIRGPIDDRVTTVSSPDTGITSVLAVPGRGGSIFGVPSVDQFVQSERLPAIA